MELKSKFKGLLNFFWFAFLAGYTANAVSYNYSASIECLAEPLVSQYEGGLVANPMFDDGLNAWDAFGNGKIEIRESASGNKFIVTYDRHKASDSVSQSFYVKEGLYYTVSAWISISKGQETVKASLRNSSGGDISLGYSNAQSGCWSMLKGGFTAQTSSNMKLYFECNDTDTELWIDSVSAKSFTKWQWRDQQNKSIEKVRKRMLRLHVSNKEGQKLEGVQITINLAKAYFPLGCATTEAILNTTGYQDWFVRRFPFTVFDNEMKWYYTERAPGQENYTIPDAMLTFFENHSISVRGHTILWNNVNDNSRWVTALSPRELVKATVRRMGSVMSRYAGKLIAWDVMNENMHYRFFEERMGPNASAVFYKIAQALDPNTTLFLNEFSTLENPSGIKSSPSNYIKRIREIKAFPGNADLVLGIGLQGHFGEPILPYVRASLDLFGETGLPVWLTELTIAKRLGPYTQAMLLEEIMREAFAHPAVHGIIVWSGWKATGCSQMCLTDENLKNLPAGDTVDKLIQEWKTTNVEGVTDCNGTYQQSLFLGDYEITLSNPYSGVKVTKKVIVDSSRSNPFDVWVTL